MDIPLENLFPHQRKFLTQALQIQARETMMVGHIDMTPFDTIIANWRLEREFCETVGPAKLAETFLSFIDMVVWQLKQQGKDVDKLNRLIKTWAELDVLAEARGASLSVRNMVLKATLEGYFNGEGYKTRSDLPAVR